MTETEKKRDPWTDPDPQPEDFDEFFANLRPEDVRYFDGSGNEVFYTGDLSPFEWVERQWEENRLSDAARAEN